MCEASFGMNKFSYSELSMKRTPKVFWVKTHATAATISTSTFTLELELTFVERNQP